MATYKDRLTFEFEIGEKDNGEKISLSVDVFHTIVVGTYEDNEATIESVEIFTERRLEEITETVKFLSPDIYEEIEAKANLEVDFEYIRVLKNGDYKEEVA